MFKKKYETYAISNALGNVVKGSPREHFTRRGAERYRDSLQKINQSYGGSLTYHAGRIGLRGYTFEIVDRRKLPDYNGMCPYLLHVYSPVGNRITHNGLNPDDYEHSLRGARAAVIRLAERHRDRNKPTNAVVERGDVL